jgi:histone arginine demethylase JMJD6
MYYGRLDAFNPDLPRFPLFAGARGYKCIQEPGDVVFTPSYWWHQVKNDIGGISFTENFVNQWNFHQVREALKKRPETAILCQFLERFSSERRAAV